MGDPKTFLPVEALREIVNFMSIRHMMTVTEWEVCSCKLCDAVWSRFEHPQYTTIHSQILPMDTRLNAEINQLLRMAGGGEAYRGPIRQWVTDMEQAVRRTGFYDRIGLLRLFRNMEYDLMQVIRRIPEEQREEVDTQVRPRIMRELEEYLPTVLQDVEPPRMSVYDMVWVERGVAKAVPNYEYRLEEYDQPTAEYEPSLKGLACFTSPQGDPQITRHQDSDEGERDGLELKPGDNFLVVSKHFREDRAYIEVYVYNEERGDWHMHHDYKLDAPPLCLSAFTYDPGADDLHGNLLAVGKRDAAVEVWDLDAVDTIPAFTLGVSPKGRKAKRHSGAVLCLDWNRINKHVIASGSVDKSLILWDLDEAKASTVVNFDSMVHSCQWDPNEQSVILTGTGADIVIVDCRTKEPQSVKWTLGDGVEVEKVAWKHSDSSHFLSVSDDGMLRYADRRKPGAFVTEVLAHEGGASGLSQSHIVDGLVATVGSKELKAWKLTGGALELLYTHPVTMGDMNVISFCPDSAYVLAVGDGMVGPVDLTQFPEVVQAFTGEGERMH